MKSEGRFVPPPTDRGPSVSDSNPPRRAPPEVEGASNSGSSPASAAGSARQAENRRFNEPGVGIRSAVFCKFSIVQALELRLE